MIIKHWTALFLALCMILSSYTIPIHAKSTPTKEVDRAMGFNYSDTSTSDDAGMLFMPMAEASEVIPSAPSNTIAKGVDISKWNKEIDFKILKANIDFVIIRCGYGSDQEDQDDPNYESYVKGCRDNKIPYGLYLYSYADTEAKSKSEAKHAIRLLNKLKSWNTKPSLPIFYDMEDDIQKSLSAKNLGLYAKNFCTAIEDAGYPAGVYASKSWWTDKFTDSFFKTTIKWVAQWPKSESAAKDNTSFYQKNADGYAIWQYTSQGSVPGITGNVDCNYMLKDIFIKESAEPENPTTQPPAQPTEPEHPTTQPPAQPTEPEHPTTQPPAQPTEPEHPTTQPPAPETKPNTPIVPDQPEVPALIAEGYTGVYDAKSHGVVIKNGKNIEYSTDKENWKTSSPTRKKVGTTTVYYKGSDSNGKKVSGELSIIVKAKNINDLKISSIKNKAYTGEQIKPDVTIEFNGGTLTKDNSYTLTYGKNISTGSATVKVKGKGNFTGSKTITFYIVPKKVSGITCSKGSKAKSAVVKWKKATGASGYQIAYSIKDKNEWNTTFVKSVSKTFTGLRNKKYDVKIRAYKIVNEKKKYGSYSTIKTMTAK